MTARSARHATEHFYGEGAQDLRLLRAGKRSKDLRDRFALGVADGTEAVSSKAWWSVAEIVICLARLTACNSSRDVGDNVAEGCAGSTADPLPALRDARNLRLQPDKSAESE
jgi:hypothetical protein